MKAIPILEFLTDFRIGGTERQAANLYSRLDPRRFELHVGCFRRLGQFLSELEGRETRFEVYPIRSLLSCHAILQELRLVRDIRRRRFRLVHTWGYYPNVFGIPAARMAGAPVVMGSIRDTGDHLTPFQRRVQRWACGLADAVVVNADAVRRRLVAEGYDDRRIRVIRNGVALDRFERSPGDPGLRDELHLPADAPVVAVLSRLNALKGIEHFLGAAAILSVTHPAARFLVVGDSSGPYRLALEQQAALLGLGGRVVFTGMRRDVPRILSQVTVSVLPSISEGLSNVVLESMAAGVPVVATDVGGNPEMVEPGVSGLLVPPRDPRALAGAIGRLLRDRALAARMGLAARATVVERFSLEAMVRQTEAFYQELVESARPQIRGLGRHSPFLGSRCWKSSASKTRTA